MSTKTKKKLLCEVGDIMRLNHYSLHTERTYIDWIKRYVQYHNMRTREDLRNGEEKVEQFLTYLAVNRHIAPLAQNQGKSGFFQRQGFEF